MLEKVGDFRLHTVESAREIYLNDSKPIARVDLMCVDQLWFDACNVDGQAQPPECFYGERYQAPGEPFSG